MTKKERTLNLILSISMCVIAAAAIFPLLHVNYWWVRYLFAAGAIGSLVVRIIQQRPKDKVMRIARLHRMELVSALCYVFSGFFMFYAETDKDWLAFLTVGAILQVYTSFMIDHAQKKELEKSKKK